MCQVLGRIVLNLGKRPVAVLRASTESEIGAAFANFGQQRVGALLVLAEAFLSSRLDQLVALADTHSIPAIYFQREFAAAGGLMSYGTDITDAFRAASVYAGRILKGDKPSDLPVQQTTKVELILNIKTAKALGITAPPALFARADDPSRQRGGHLAARGTGAAAGSASGGHALQRVGGAMGRQHGRVPPWARRDRLRGGPQCRDRVALGDTPTRSREPGPYAVNIRLQFPSSGCNHQGAIFSGRRGSHARY
jgi:hypothetical protein